MKQKKIWSHSISMLLILALCIPMLPVTKITAQAADMTEADIDTRSAMVVEYDANSSSVEELLNSQTLHPQKTGYAALDKLLESVLAPYAGKSTAEKVKACYAWTVRNIDYSWAGYTRANSGYNGFKQTYPYNDYEDGLQKAFPEDVIARTYYTMSKHKGVCYDWGAVFAVMVRYIGIDAYVHTGDFKFEQELGFSSSAHGHHGWTEIVLNGKYYIFDPQREYRMTNNGKGTISYTRYFGVTSGSKNYYRYTEETKINASRDAGFLSVSAHRQKFVAVNAVASRSGSVSGTGKYDVGTNATLTATPQSGKSFEGWYDYAGNLLSSDAAYTFTVSGPMTIYAMFSGDLFYDVNHEWYAEAALRAGEQGLIAGTAPHQFNGNGIMTRATAVTILANMENADLSGYTSTKFNDVPAGQWYTAAVAWANENGIVMGINEITFRPNDTVTREQFVVMVINYLNWKQVKLTAAELTYSDSALVSDWARTQMELAQGIGLISGYNDGRVGAQDAVSRAQGVSIMMNTVDFLATEMEQDTDIDQIPLES